MRISIIKRIGLALFVTPFFLSLSLQGQTLESARALYKEKQYTQALPIFKKFIERQPTNAPLNQWYGACLYETGDRAGAEKYLKFAASRNIQESYRYLAEYYFDEYRFDESRENYEKYKIALEKAKLENPALPKLIEQASLGARMIERVENVQIIDSLVVDKINFFSHYKLSPESGTLHAVNSFFDPSDKGKNALVHQNQRTDKVIYSSRSKQNGYDLFTRLKTSDSKWGEELPLPGNINTKNNENYPFLLADGVTLYYAADGENSLGGYDIFVTRLNLNTGNFLNPENMGMPFNSPFNDYLLAIDEVNNVGWFVSDRYQPANKVIIYLFIPSAEKQIYRGVSDEQMRQLARITSIRATWGKNARYDELLEQIYQVEEKIEKEPEAQFLFPLRGEIIYTRIENFRSEEARNLYVKAMEITKQMDQLNSQLEIKRADFIQSKGKKSALNAEILSLEETLLSLYGKPETFASKARNSEILFLDKKK